MTINQVAIEGNLTRDSELRTTASGMSVLDIGIAVNDRRQNKQTNEWEDKPNFFDCTMFGTRAEKLAGYLVKGTKVCITGKLDWSQWDDPKTGEKKSKVRIIVNEIAFMSPRDSQQTQAPPVQTTAYQPQNYAPQTYTYPPQGYQQQAYQQPPQQAYPPQNQPQNGYQQPDQTSIYDQDIPF